MLVGEEVKVRIKSKISENKAIVEIVQTGESAILSIKGHLRVSKDGTISAWVIQNNTKSGDTVLGNAYFGKYDISPNITEKYKTVLNKIFNTPNEIIDEDISLLKGMVNRCIKHDQWDWYTTYKYLGYPTYQIMKTFVKESVIVRNSVRKNEKELLYEFRKKYSFILRGILSHLDNNLQLCDLNDIEPIGILEQELWERMSYDSRHNIRIAERIADSSSKYILMHYLVTLENEFFAHYIQPFINDQGCQIISNCQNPRIRTTHMILSGKKHFSLGSVFYLCKNLENPYALEDSEVIREFYNYLGNKRELFKEFCNIINTQIICGISIIELRNGLAHGDSEIISKIDSNAYSEMYDFLFNSPNFLMKQLLENSLKYNQTKK